MKEHYSEAAICGVALLGVLLYTLPTSYPPNIGAKVLGGKSPRGQKS